jgi:hypothetical protein
MSHINAAVQLWTAAEVNPVPFDEGLCESPRHYSPQAEQVAWNARRIGHEYRTRLQGSVDPNGPCNDATGTHDHRTHPLDPTICAA